MRGIKHSKISYLSTFFQGTRPEKRRAAKKLIKRKPKQVSFTDWLNNLIKQTTTIGE